MTEKSLNPTLADVEAELRLNEDAMARAGDIADKLEAMSWAGILRGAVEDIGADEVLLLGAMDGHWLRTKSGSFRPPKET